MDFDYLHHHDHDLHDPPHHDSNQHIKPRLCKNDLDLGESKSFFHPRFLFFVALRPIVHFEICCMGIGGDWGVGGGEKGKVVTEA